MGFVLFTYGLQTYINHAHGVMWEVFAQFKDFILRPFENGTKK